MKVTIRDENGDEKNVGEYFEKDKLFFKMVKPEWFHRKTNSWGIDAEVFNNFIKDKCTKIELKEYKTNKTYTTTVDNFDKHSHYKHWKPYRAQRFLALEHWEIK